MGEGGGGIGIPPKSECIHLLLYMRREIEICQMAVWDRVQGPRTLVIKGVHEVVGEEGQREVPNARLARGAVDRVDPHAVLPAEPKTEGPKGLDIKTWHGSTRGRNIQVQ